MTKNGQRRVVWGTWHPKVDVNAVAWDNEPQKGIAVGDAQADTLRVVSPEMGNLIFRQEMCWRCLQEFPCAMSSMERFSRWAEAIDRGQFRCGGVLTRQLVLDRALARLCPMCAAPITDRMLAGQVRITDVRRGDE